MIVSHQDGELALGFRCDASGRTHMAWRRQRFPLRTTVPFYLDSGDPGMAFVYVQNPTGGMFAGDRLATEVVAERGARVHLTTQSATKLYRMESGGAVQDLAFRLHDGAFVEHVPDPLIPQAGARFRQRIAVELGHGATFLATEVVAPGRRARGERFAYRSLLLSTEVRRAGRELCADTLLLEPQRRSPALPGLLGRHDYLASLLVVAPEHDAERLSARLDRALQARSDVLGAAGALPGGSGALVRVLAEGALAVRRALAAAWGVTRAELFDLPLPAVRK